MVSADGQARGGGTVTDPGIKGFVGGVLAEVLYKLGLLDSVFAATFDCTVCARLVPERLMYQPPYIDLAFRGSFCQRCGRKRAQKASRH